MKQKILNFWHKSDIWTAVLSVAALLLIVVPLAYISRYMWPVSDDFGLSLTTKEVYEATGSMWEVLKEAWKAVVDNYFHWQGAYSSILLMALQPGIWGDECYGMGVVLIIGSLFIAVYWLSYVLMVKHGKAPKSTWLTITSLVSFVWMLRLMYTEEAFYWWTGASYYTGFYAWGMMIVAAMCTFYTDWQKYGKFKKSFFYIIGILACLFVGGGNFPTTLLLALIGGGLAGFAYFYKKPAFKVIAVYEAAVLTALFTSVLAPGNSTHMNNDFEANISAVEAVFISIRDGLKYIGSWTNISVIMLFIFLVPFIWKLVKSCGWKFKWPVVVTILSGGLYLAEYAPVSYAFGGFAPGRMINLYYINYFWLMLFNVFYWLGWIHTVLTKNKAAMVQKIADRQYKWQPVYVCAAGVLLLLSIASIGITNTNLYWVYADLYNGRYQELDKFYEERVAYFEEHQGEDVVVERIPYESVITYFSDLFPDKDHMVNVATSQYYGVNSISLKEE